MLELDGDFQTYGQDKKPLTPFKYNPEFSIEENLNNPEGHSWHTAWFLQLERAMQSPKYQTPTDLIRNSGLKKILAEEYFVPYGWEGEGLRDGKKLGELQMRNVQVQCPGFPTLYVDRKLTTLIQVTI